ncbi:hypothetical protein ACJX0J_032272, partial [Zea mays]
ILSTLASRIENQGAIDTAIVGMLADPKEPVLRELRSLAVVIRLNIAESKLAIDHVWGDIYFENYMSYEIIYAIITINQRDMTMKIRDDIACAEDESTGYIKGDSYENAFENIVEQLNKN